MSKDDQNKFTIIECPNNRCKRKLRIPKTEKSLRITCPKCETEFLYPQKKASIKKPYSCWIKKRIKDHPFLFGSIITFYLLMIASRHSVNELYFEEIIYMTIACSAIWLIGVRVLDCFIEKGIKWYYQKWFVLVLLFALPPIGITLLWAGSKFSKPVKAILSIVSGSWLAFNLFSSSPKEFVFSPIDQVADVFFSHKGETFLKSANNREVEGFREFILHAEYPIPFAMTVPQIFNKWDDSLVVVLSIDKKGEILVQGSGFIVSPDGVVATNYHVIESAYEVFIRLANGKNYQDTTLIAGYPDYDIAILKIEEAETFDYVFFGDSDEVQIGEQVLTIGSPLGFENTISDGIISGKRDIGDITLLQITAPISSGSSGGALINVRGEIIGITSIGSRWNAQNLNFAIPINALKYLIEDDL